MIAALIATIFSNQSHADCTATGVATYNCAGVSVNSVPLTGTLTLDNAAGNVTFSNQPNNKIVNDRTLDSGGEMNLLQTNGSNNVLINNLGILKSGRGVIYATDADGNVLTDGTGAQLYDLVSEQVFNLDGTPFLVNGQITFQDVVVYRTDADGNILTDGTGLPIEQSPAFLIDPTKFSNNGAGHLLYDGAAAGLATTLHLGKASTSATINNLLGPQPSRQLPPEYFGYMSVDGDFSSVIFGNTANIVINNYAGIDNRSFSGSVGDTFSEGHWAIANYGAGTTTINMNAGFAGVYGDIVLIDRNPLLEAAQKLNPSLVLEYDVNNVGIRNSVINLGNTGNLNQAGITGNIYLGAGEHVINLAVSGRIDGNIYVDQKDAQVTDATGNVISTIAGAKKFTFNSDGTFDNTLTINDVAGSVNTLNFNLGNFVTSNFNSDTAAGSGGTPTVNVLNGLGSNVLNAHCNQRLDNGFATCSMSDATGLTSINISGGKFFDLNSATIVQASSDININARTFIFNHLLSAPTVTIGADTTVSGYFFNDETVDYRNPPPNIAPDEIGVMTGNVLNHGKIDVRNATMTINGDITFDANSNLTLRIRDIGNGGLNIVGGAGSFIDNASVTPTIKDVYVRNGQAFTIANNTTGTPAVNNATGIVQFTSDDSTGDLRLIAKVAIPNSVNASVSANNAVDSIMNYSGGDAEFNALALQIQTLNALELKRAAERLRPENHDGAIRLVQSNVDQIFGMVDSHLFENQVEGSGSALTYSPEDKKVSGSSVWAQGFGSGGTQDSRNNTDGYALKSSGFAFGADRLLGKNQDLRLGVLAAYSRGNIDNTGYTDNSRVDVNAYTLGLYGTQSFGDWYINGATAFSINHYTSKRLALGQVADGTHQSKQYSAKVDAGWPIQLAENFTIIPMASLNYQHINESGYTETGDSLRQTGVASPYAASLQTIPSIDSATRLTIGNRSFDSIRSGLGAKTLFNVQEKDWNAGLELSAILTHEFGDLAQDATARFVAGGESFYSPGVELARNTVVLGGRARLTGDDDNNQITLLASYDAEFREKYFGQSLSMQLRYDFDQASAYIERANTRKEKMQKNAVPTQLVTATEQDIADITQAMQASTQKIVEPISLENQQRLAISKVLNYWINALTSKSVENYFNVYAADFVISEGGTRQQWERKRKLEILKSDRPVISIVNLSIKPNGNEASAYFTLTMQDGSSKQAVLKSIDFVKKGERWLISSEDGITMSE